MKIGDNRPLSQGGPASGGLTILSSILIYYFKYIYNREDMTTFALLILLLSSMAFIPVWNVLSRKIGKKKGYIAGMLILAAMITLIFFFAANRVRS